MKTILIASAFFAISFFVNAQDESHTLSFCNETGFDGRSGKILSKEQLSKCDLELHSLNPEMKVVNFKLTIVNNEGASEPIEISGNKIPEEYREKLLSNTTHFFLEFINGTTDGVSVRSLMPIRINIK